MIMKAGKETEMYNQGYMDGYNDGENAHIDPDYWTRLEHQYAGMAMQVILASCEHYRILSSKQVTLDAYKYAHALIQKLKEKEEK